MLWNFHANEIFWCGTEYNICPTFVSWWMGVFNVSASHRMWYPPSKTISPRYFRVLYTKHATHAHTHTHIRTYTCTHKILCSCLTCITYTISQLYWSPLKLTLRWWGKAVSKFSHSLSLPLYCSAETRKRENNKEVAIKQNMLFWFDQQKKALEYSEFIKHSENRHIKTLICPFSVFKPGCSTWL